MSSFIGKKLTLSVFGESHGAGVGCVLDGLPAGLPVDTERLQAFLSRRAPGRSPLSTARRESDTPVFQSGMLGGFTTGAPLCAFIPNEDPRSQDYAPYADTPRPGHADYTAGVRYGGHADLRGGGHFSGRLTAALCIAGGICLQALEAEGIRIGAHILSVGAGNAKDIPFDPCSPAAQLALLSEKAGGCAFPVLDDAVGERMREEILAAKAEGDSLGGVIECAAAGVPAGLGDPMFDGMENVLSRLLFSVPALRGVSFGDGCESGVLFPFSSRRGSENNDAFLPGNAGDVKTASNHCGGILGGITTGMPVLFSCGIKPTPSIAKEQMTVDLRTGDPAKISVGGRHDPCILPRAVPCVEAAAAVGIFDALLSGKAVR